jgi:hypothetical protein
LDGILTADCTDLTGNSHPLDPRNPRLKFLSASGFFTGKTVICENAFMRKTVELPDDLFRRAKTGIANRPAHRESRESDG